MYINQTALLGKYRATNKTQQTLSFIYRRDLSLLRGVDLEDELRLLDLADDLLALELFCEDVDFAGFDCDDLDCEACGRVDRPEE